jgi:hypothetical protein
MARMLAESLSSASAVTQPAGSASILAWIVFVALVVLGAAAIPFLARLLRRGLHASRRDSVPLEPVVFGYSPRARRSPRHAVRQHRTLMTTGFIAVLSLVVLTGIAALQSLGVSGLQVAIALVLPSLLVALHARQRNLQR